MKKITISNGYAMKQFEEFKKLYNKHEQQMLEYGIIDVFEYPGDDMLILFAIRIAIEHYQSLIR